MLIRKLLKFRVLKRLQLRCVIICSFLFAVTLFVLPAAAEKQNVIHRPDGSIINWYLSHPVNTNKSGIVVLAQGSGCQSVATSQNIKLARSVFSEFTVLTVDKYGVAAGDNPPDSSVTNCSKTFYAHNTMTQRVDDYLQILEVLRKLPWWNGKLALFGGSEGGDVVARLAAATKTDAVILLSTGGGTTFGELVRQSIHEEMLRNSVPKEHWPQVETAFAEARKNPLSSEIWAGSSYRFWADAIDRRPADDMLRSDAAFLLIQGGGDTSAPVSTARATLDLFAKAQRCNLTYWELAGYSHGMRDTNKQDRMADVLAQSANWLKLQLAQEKPVTSCEHKE